jgi:hypothetical protein
MFYFKLYFLISVVLFPFFITIVVYDYYKVRRSIRLAFANLTIEDLMSFIICPLFWPLFCIGVIFWLLEKFSNIADYRPFKFLEKGGK